MLMSCRAQRPHLGPNRPLIDLMQPTENLLRRGRVFSGAYGGLHHVYHWPATARMRFSAQQVMKERTTEARFKRLLSFAGWSIVTLGFYPVFTLLSPGLMSSPNYCNRSSTNNEDVARHAAVKVARSP